MKILYKQRYFHFYQFLLKKNWIITKSEICCPTLAEGFILYCQSTPQVLDLNEAIEATRKSRYLAAREKILTEFLSP